MTLIVRAIFRLDFETCYEIINRQGDVIRLLVDLDGQDWDGFSDAQKSRAVTVVRTREDEHEEMTVDPRSISGSHEWKGGVDYDAGYRESIIDRPSLAFEEFRAEFGISRLARVGVRLLMTGQVNGDNMKSRQAFNTKFAEPFLRSPFKELSEIDTAVVVEGTIAENLGFRIHSGPGGKLDLPRFMARLKTGPFEDSGLHDFAADIDIFETGIDLRGTTLKRWYRQKLEYFDKLIECAKQGVVIDAAD